MSDLEQCILDIIQDGFPVVERPYAAIADMVGGSEQQVFEIVERLRESDVIRRIGGVYDSKCLGLVSRLCTGKVPAIATGAADDSALETFADAVLKIPAITHNYVRSNDYNVWFTIIAESEAELQSVIDKLCKETALHDVHSMPAKRMFKINTVMKRLEAPGSRPESTTMPEAQSAKAAVLSDLDKVRIRLLSGDLPHTLSPFKEWAKDLACKILPEDLLKGAHEDLALKRMRRFGAVLRHQNAGFPSNAMVCFRLEAQGIGPEEGGVILADNPHVSHCYERPPFDGFPYNVYAMFHAQNDNDLLRYVNEAAVSLGNPDYAVLHSLRELKKTSYKYFAD